MALAKAQFLCCFKSLAKKPRKFAGRAMGMDGHGGQGYRRRAPRFCRTKPNDRADSMICRFSPDRPPADVAAAETLGPIDAVDRRVGAALRLGHGPAARHHVEDAAAVGDEAAVLAPCPGVEDRHQRIRGGGLEAADLGAAPGLAGIAP